MTSTILFFPQFYAFVASSVSLRRLSLGYPCLYSDVGPTLVRSASGFGLPKDSQYKGLFDSVIRRLQENGVIGKIFGKHQEKVLLSAIHVVQGGQKKFSQAP